MICSWRRRSKEAVCTLHIYNDDGGPGSFCELECNSSAMGDSGNTRVSEICLDTWIFIGKGENMAGIKKSLLFPDDTGSVTRKGA